MNIGRTGFGTTGPLETTARHRTTYKENDTPIENDRTTYNELMSFHEADTMRLASTAKQNESKHCLRFDHTTWPGELALPIPYCAIGNHCTRSTICIRIVKMSAYLPN